MLTIEVELTSIVTRKIEAESSSLRCFEPSVHEVASSMNFVDKGLKACHQLCFDYWMMFGIAIMPAYIGALIDRVFKR